jgi:hypothetical protein
MSPNGCISWLFVDIEDEMELPAVEAEEFLIITPCSTNQNGKYSCKIAKSTVIIYFYLLNDIL